MGADRPRPRVADGPGAVREDVADPSLSILGSWSYCVVGTYHISRTAAGQLLFQERHADGKEVSGILRAAEDSEGFDDDFLPESHFQADIFSKDGFCGVLRVALSAQRGDLLLTVFKALGTDEWSPAVCAQRLMLAAASNAKPPGRAPEVGCWPSLLGSAAKTKLGGCSGLAKLVGARQPDERRAEEGGVSVRVADVWELQRRAAPFSDRWYAPFLPHDRWRGLSRWVDEDFQRHPWVALGQEAGDLADTPPLIPLKGWRLDAGEWAVVRPHGRVDPDGWQYAFDFTEKSSHWGEYSAMHYCRRRLWRCLVARAPAKAGVETTQGHLPEAAADSLDRRFEVVADELVGPLRLEEEAARLLADEWTAGCFVLDFLAASDGTEIQVGPWLEEQEGARVREVTLRVPCPPNPMSPETTMARVRYRIRVDGRGDATSLRYTAEWSLLDVPYGDYFTVFERVSLAPAEGGRTRATKAFKMEFSKSTLFRSVIETATRGAAVCATPVFTSLARQRAKA